MIKDWSAREVRAWRTRKGERKFFCQKCLQWHAGHDLGPHSFTCGTYYLVDCGRYEQRPENLHDICVPDWASGVIYFIRQGKSGCIKIGYTSDCDLSSRLIGLQVGNPFKLRVVGVLFGDRETERKLHRMFLDLRMNGEWFRPNKKLTSYIKECSIPVVEGYEYEEKGKIR